VIGGTGMGLVQVILREDVQSLGEAGDLVKVKPGYARNYLLPTGKALIATDARVHEFEHKKRVIADKLAKERSSLEALQTKLSGMALEFTAQAGEEGRLFGSVTAVQIAERLSQNGLAIDRRKIALKDAIKSVGEHTVEIRLGQSLVAEVKVKVSATE
jgi:large subunit ribosomal protein L9